MELGPNVYNEAFGRQGGILKYAALPDPVGSGREDLLSQDLVSYIQERRKRKTR